MSKKRIKRSTLVTWELLLRLQCKTKNRRYHVSFRNGKRGFYCKEELQTLGSPVLEYHDLFSTCVKSMSGFSAQVRVGVLIDEAAYILSRQSSQEIWMAIPYPTSEGRFTRRYNRVELRTAIDRSQMKWFRPQPGSECEEHETSSVILDDDRFMTSDSVDNDVLLLRYLQAAYIFKHRAFVVGNKLRHKSITRCATTLLNQLFPIAPCQGGTTLPGQLMAPGALLWDGEN